MKRRAQPWLGTLVEITIADALDDKVLNSCFNNAFSAIATVHRLMSFHDPASDVSRINHAPIDELIEVDAHTYTVIQTALSIAIISKGLFNINCAPKLVEWGYLPRPTGSLPEYIPACSTLILEGDYRIKKTRVTWIDLGGIAKGYAVDLAITVLRQSGIQSACVNAGGDLRVYGSIAYPVTIRDPEYPTKIGLQTEIHNTALATSGTYFSRKNIDGHEVSALVHGKNGHPLTSNFSASVCAPTCLVADALTKVVLASGNQRHPALNQFDATAFINLPHAP